MIGEVAYIHAARDMVAVLSDGEDYSIIELLGDEVEIGDRLQWQDFHPLGGETIRNLTKGCTLSVFFQNHGVPQSQLRQQLLY